MVYDGIYINYDNLVQISSDLLQKINAIKSCYDSVKTAMKEIDGTTDTWQGEDQKIFYAALEKVTNNYNDNISKLTEIYDFLRKIIDNYKTRDETFSKDLDNNAKNLDV